MDASLKALTKLQKLVSGAGSSKGKSPSIDDSLDALLRSLNETKDKIQSGAASPGTYVMLSKKVESTKKDIDERQKEVYNSLARFGKALDKRFPTPLPSYQAMFSSPEAVTALERTIATHFLRTGQFDTAETFIEVSRMHASALFLMKSGPRRRQPWTSTLKCGCISLIFTASSFPNLRWTVGNRAFLEARSSPLEFYLPLSPTQRPTSSRSIARLQVSPYADLASPALHLDLEPMFAKEYCANLGMSRQVPLRVVGDIGGGGALARIEKGRKVMRERKSEWSQSDELPIEIPLPVENRYHSVFACPVSKEQATEANPPMMLNCAHVITKDSLQKLSKPGGKVKCPYCPEESNLSSALRVHF